MLPVVVRFEQKGEVLPAVVGLTEGVGVASSCRFNIRGVVLISVSGFKQKGEMLPAVVRSKQTGGRCC